MWFAFCVYMMILSMTPESFEQIDASRTGHCKKLGDIQAIDAHDSLTAAVANGAQRVIEGKTRGVFQSPS